MPEGALIEAFFQVKYQVSMMLIILLCYRWMTGMSEFCSVYLPWGININILIIEPCSLSETRMTTLSAIVKYNYNRLKKECVESYSGVVLSCFWRNSKDKKDKSYWLWKYDFVSLLQFSKGHFNLTIYSKCKKTKYSVY